MASIFNKIDLINNDNTYSTLRMSNYGSINSVLTSNGNGTSDWADIYLQKSGGTMTGDIEMNNNAVKSTFTPNANNVLTNKLYVDSAVSNITLSSVGTGTALTSSTTNPNFSLKSILVGAGLSMTSVSNTITLTNSSPATNITLGSSGEGSSLVNNGSYPNLIIKSISPGNNINFTETPDNIIINSASTSASIFSGYPFNPIQFCTSTIEPSEKNYYYICFMNRYTSINGIQFYTKYGSDNVRCGIYSGYISQNLEIPSAAELVGQTDNEKISPGLPYTRKDIIPVRRDITFQMGECMIIAFHAIGSTTAYYQNQPLSELDGNTEIMFSSTKNYVEEGFPPFLEKREIDSPILSKICFELY